MALNSHPWIKNDLLRARTTNRYTEESKSTRCNGKRCQVCQYIEKTCEFEDADWNKYDICKRVKNSNTVFTTCKFHCGSCSKQYIGRNITDFRYQFNNYKRVFCEKSKSTKPPNVNQEHFQQHFKLPEHNNMDDWRVTIIYRADNVKELRKRKSLGQYKLNTFFPQGLNKRNIPAECE